MDDAVRSNSARCLVTGKLAALWRARALEASRLVISASMRVRRKSSGLQRCFGRDQQLGRDSAHGGQLQSAQPSRQVGG